MITRDLLRTLRNDLPMSFVIRHMGGKAPYSKTVEGRLRFQCPHCGETLASINPRNNLAHCFGCGKNTNNIDLLMAVGYDFRDAVRLLEDWLSQYNSQRALVVMLRRPVDPDKRSDAGPVPIGALLRPDPGSRSAPGAGGLNMR